MAKRANRTTWRDRYGAMSNDVDEVSSSSSSPKKIDMAHHRSMMGSNRQHTKKRGPKCNNKMKKIANRLRAGRTATSNRRRISSRMSDQLLIGTGLIIDDEGNNRYTKSQPAKLFANKSISRRSCIFKSTKPVKSISRRANVTTANSVWHKNRVFTTGDIISVIDDDDGLMYYAQIRGLLTDPYADKFAALTWLVPTIETIDPHCFDPATFVHSSISNRLHSLDSIDFIQHRPPNYCSTRWSPKMATEMMLHKQLQQRQIE